MVPVEVPVAVPYPVAVPVQEPVTMMVSAPQTVVEPVYLQPMVEQVVPVVLESTTERKVVLPQMAPAELP